MIEKNRTQVNLIEKSANFEGNETIVFLGRLNNPEVKKKLLESIIRDKIFLFLKNLKTELKKDEENIKENIKREEKEKLNERIQLISNSTEIDFDSMDNAGSSCNAELGGVGRIAPLAIWEEGNILTKKQLSIAEAHEKGHCIRSFDSVNDDSPIRVWVRSAFDFSIKPTLSEKELDKLKNIFYNKEQIISFDEMIESGQTTKDKFNEILITDYLSILESTDEIIERMSQLKNYFGMKGNEQFTKEHLDYARKHYGEDTGFVLQIKMIFDLITKDTEKNFLDVINNLGV